MVSGAKKTKNSQTRNLLRKELLDEGLPSEAAEAAIDHVQIAQALMIARDLRDRDGFDRMLVWIRDWDRLRPLEKWLAGASRFQRRSLVRVLVGQRTPGPVVAMMTGCELAMIRHHARRMRITLPALHWGRDGRP